MSDEFAAFRPTYIENWGDALYGLTVPHVDIAITRPEARALGLRSAKFARWFGEGPAAPLDRVAGELDAALRSFPGGAFVRLGSRSGKDSTYARNHGLRVTDAGAAMRMLTEDSRRIAFDLRLALRHNYCPHIFVRRWLEIPEWSEFRCFMRDRKLVGISQYDCINLGSRREITERAGQIRSAVERFFEEFRAACHLDTVVFDVFVDLDARPGTPGPVTLLELNPFLPKTDACLFSWRDGGDFDGSFRVL